MTFEWCRSATADNVEELAAMVRPGGREEETAMCSGNGDLIEVSSLFDSVMAAVSDV